MLADQLQERVKSGPPILLDGALGTELERAGVASTLPLWSTQALLEEPAAVERIHASYASAGAEILTAATFRTQARTLARAGLAAKPRDASRLAAELTRAAVALARSAGIPGAEHEVQHAPLVAGSAPPLEDCYRPDLVPPPDVLAREHGEHADNLAAAEVDLILVETMNSIAEATAAARAARRTGLPFFVSFVCGRDGTLLSQESLERAIDAVRDTEPVAVLVNCTPPSALDSCIAVLRACGLPFGVYPNLGEPTGPLVYREAISPDDLARLARSWLTSGAAVIGGCCGTGPDHTRALAGAISSHRAARD